MGQDPKEKAIAEWLQTVDKPVGKKEEQKQSSVDQFRMEQTEK